MPKTMFRPSADGFAFQNRWTFDQTETDQIRRCLTDCFDGVLTTLNPTFGGALALVDVGTLLANWVDNGLPQTTYGLCGGMAFAALDYYQSGLLVPRGVGLSDQPVWDSPVGATLRTYLLQRMIASLTAGGAAAESLAWMAVLHAVPEVGPFPSGAAWLLARSKEEWSTLKKHIDAKTPWPIGLVGSSTDPFSNHQVVAYGYDDPGDGTGTIFVYDMNCPDSENTIHLNFGGPILTAKESCPSKARGELRGFFCEAYAFANPPDVGLQFSALQKEQTPPTIYVIYGGAKIAIPTLAELNTLGYSQAWVRVLPDGALAALPTIPRDGTLVRELSSPQSIYIVEAGKKLAVTAGSQLGPAEWLSHGIRVVPDGTLTGFPDGGLV